MGGQFLEHLDREISKPLPLAGQPLLEGRIADIGVGEKVAAIECGVAWRNAPTSEEAA